jgi:hypothetical protein
MPSDRDLLVERKPINKASGCSEQLVRPVVAGERESRGQRWEPPVRVGEVGWKAAIVPLATALQGLGLAFER